MKLEEEGIFVIKNCIHPNLQDAIEEYYFSDSYVWSDKTGKYQDQLKGKKLTTDISNPKIEDGPLLNEFEFDLIVPILKSCLEQINVEYNKSDVILVRTLMQIPKESNARNNIHVDTNKKCYTVVYYVNDSDGDTIFLNKTTKEFSFENYEKMRFDEDWYKKQKEIFTDASFTETPKKGTAVIFDGSIYHASSCPTKNKRCVINFNYRWN
jgi:hypothetical protein